MYTITEQECYTPTTGARRVLRTGLIAVILDLITIHDVLQTNHQRTIPHTCKFQIVQRDAQRSQQQAAKYLAK